jgi:Na+/H+ antiporter NhaD/arsenite permease-like protein
MIAPAADHRCAGGGSAAWASLVGWIFALVYLGMLLGRYPRLQLDRTGIALLGAIALLASGALDLDGAVAAVDWATISVLFALMVVSAQLRLGGFYTRVSAAITARPWPPARLLAGQVAVTGLLAAVFTNDIVCLAVAPVVLRACARRGLDPLPHLLGVACAANVGSAATLIGNPQNILIGERLGLDFAGYLGVAAPPALVGLVAVWAVIAWQYRGRWQAPAAALTVPAEALLPAWDGWQAGKGLAVVGLLLLAFLFGDWPRYAVALAAAGVLLTSRRLHSRQTLGLVDWQLLVLFVGLFVVNAAFQATGLPDRGVAAAAAAGIDLAHPGWLFALTVALSNLVSNVPAVMLLLPLADGPVGGPLLALASTLAGNLLLVGSIANLIVADIALRHGVAFGWAAHARSGVPVTLLTLVLAAGWLAWIHGG